MAHNTPYTATAGTYGRNSEAETTATAGGAAGANKLWLPIWSGEVLRAYDNYRVFEPMVEARTISSGTTMEFPITGTAALKPAWGAGEELIGNVDDHASTTVAVNLDNRPIASHFEIDNIDMMISQWEFRSELARQVGQTIAKARDLQIGAYIVRAACENQIATDPRLATVGNTSKWRNTLKEAPIFHIGDAAEGVGIFSNTELDHIGSGSPSERAGGALALLDCIEKFMVHLQEIGAPGDGVFCAVTPAAFQDIRALGVARVSGDLAGGAGRPMFGGVADAGGLGTGLGDGMMAISDSLEYMGCTIVKTNNMPNFDAGLLEGSPLANTRQIGEARYNLNFSGTARNESPAPAGNYNDADGIDVRALIWQAGCVASIQKTGLKVDTVDDVRRNTVFTVASMLSGTGVLKPECASVVMGKDLGTDTKAQARTLLGMGAEWIVTS